MADSRSSESSFISRSDYLDFGASMEGEHNERVHEPVVKIRPLRFKPLGRSKLSNAFCGEIARFFR